MNTHLLQIAGAKRTATYPLKYDRDIRAISKSYDILNNRRSMSTAELLKVDGESKQVIARFSADKFVDGVFPTSGVMRRFIPSLLPEGYGEWYGEDNDFFDACDYLVKFDDHIHEGSSDMFGVNAANEDELFQRVSMVTQAYGFRSVRDGVKVMEAIEQWYDKYELDGQSLLRMQESRAV